MKQELDGGNLLAAVESMSSRQQMPGKRERLLDRFGQANQELSQLLENWQQQARNLACINRIAHAVVSTLDLPEILSAAAGEIQQALHVEFACIALMEAETEAMVIQACVAPESYRPCPRRILCEHEVAAQVVRSGYPLCINDLGLEPHFCHGVGPDPGVQIHSILCVPLLVSGGVIGAVQVLNRLDNKGPAEQAKFTGQDQELLQGIAAFVAMAAENAQLHIAMREQAALETLKKTVVALAHHINNPLQALVGAADVLRTRLSAPPSEGSTPDELLDIILDEAHEIAAVLQILQEIGMPRSTVYLEGQQMFDIELELQTRLTAHRPAFSSHPLPDRSNVTGETEV